MLNFDRIAETLAFEFNSCTFLCYITPIVLVQQVLPRRVPTANMDVVDGSPVRIYVGTVEDLPDVMTCVRTLGVQQWVHVSVRDGIPAAGISSAAIKAAAADRSGMLASQLASNELRRRLQSATIEYWAASSDTGIGSSHSVAPMIRVRVPPEDFDLTTRWAQPWLEMKQNWSCRVLDKHIYTSQLKRDYLDH
jgi:hypothetical protein